MITSGSTRFYFSHTRVCGVIFYVTAPDEQHANIKHLFLIYQILYENKILTLYILYTYKVFTIFALN